LWRPRLVSLFVMVVFETRDKREPDYEVEHGTAGSTLPRFLSLSSPRGNQVALELPGYLRGRPTTSLGLPTKRVAVGLVWFSSVHGSTLTSEDSASSWKCMSHEATSSQKPYTLRSNRVWVQGRPKHNLSNPYFTESPREQLVDRWSPVDREGSQCLTCVDEYG
jgi:hypothetical protein